MSEDLPLRVQLERYYRETTDPQSTISDFTPISDGWETEVYSFTLTLRHQVEHLILRMYPGTEAPTKSQREFAGLRLLRRLAYPVPLVMHHEAYPVWLGQSFLIMEKIDGQPLGLIIREQPERFPELITRFSQLLVDLHRLDYHLSVPSETKLNAARMLRRKYADARRLIINLYNQTWANPVFDWLKAGLSDVEKTASLSVTHNDFHPWNILVTADDKTYVIDWSLIEINDYRFDLGWTLLLATRISPQRDLVLSEYERLSGHSIDHIEYFEVVGALRRLFDLAASLTSGAESLGMRPDTVETMRRQHDHYQQVYDLLSQYTGLRLPEIERLIDTLKG